jgi:hypothetical protein
MHREHETPGRLVPVSQDKRTNNLLSEGDNLHADSTNALFTDSSSPASSYGTHHMGTMKYLTYRAKMSGELGLYVTTSQNTSK